MPDADDRPNPAPNPEPTAETVIPVVAETLSVRVARRITGRVTVTTRTESHETTTPVTLTEQQVEVIRVPVDRAVDRVPDIVTEGDLTIIPVTEERVVVTRQLFLREEIHIRRRTASEVVDMPVTLRSQTATIRREAAGEDGTFPLTPSERTDNDL